MPRTIKLVSRSLTKQPRITRSTPFTYEWKAGRFVKMYMHKGIYFQPTTNVTYCNATN
jgi:hypothetical protein